MDWDLKMPSWDFVEVEQSAGTNIGSVDCLVDLKLGGLGEGWKNRPRMSEMPSGSGSSKRARTPHNGRQVASCLVDGCTSDLSKCREYHRRHKVCEAHSKTQMVMVAGQEQRFCQQCSRFHSLLEFDEVKRSCRKRLDGHNRRRRKPQPDPTATFFTNHQGGSFISYPPMFPAAAQSLTWPGIVKIEDETFCNNQQPLSFPGRQQEAPTSFSICFKDGKKFPFLQCGNTKDSACQSLLKNIASGNSSTKAFPDGVARIRSSECALSLLSSPTRAAMNLGQMVPADRIPFGQPLISVLPYSGLCQYSCLPASTSVSPTGLSCSGMADDHGGTILVSDASNTDLHCHGFFHVGIEGSSAGTCEAFPFGQ